MLRHSPSAAVVTALLVAAVTALSLAAFRARAQPPGASFDLARYRDKNRLLLLFAPSAGDPSYAAEVSALRARQSDTDARELLPVTVLESGASSADGRPLSASDAAALRRRYRAPAGRFTAVLVGKDGRAALRSTTPIVADRLFPTIDAMPMRRDEVRRRRGG